MFVCSRRRLNCVPALCLPSLSPLSGLGPILFKQIPYTMAKFAVQGLAAEQIYGALGTNPKKSSSGTNVAISLASGVIAGVAAAVISHPADTLLSKINKAGVSGILWCRTWSN
jgi:solute carrier family 25 (mitochondrial phosphate transporter), member 3